MRMLLDRWNRRIPTNPKRNVCTTKRSRQKVFLQTQMMKIKIYTEYVDTRVMLLNLCERKNYFDTLRRAKHSTMMILYLLHEERKKQQQHWKKVLDLLVHEFECPAPWCNYVGCRKLKSLSHHVKVWETRAKNGCTQCIKMWLILKVHARNCNESECSLPRCSYNMEKDSNPFPPVQQQAPWLFFFSHGKHKNKQSFFSIVEGKSYVENIREMSRKTCLMHSHGWLLMYDNRTNNCSLINPKTKETIKLPPLLPFDEFSYGEYGCYMSSAPTDQNCVVLFISCGEQSIMFCRPSDSTWRTMNYEMDEEGGLWDFVTCNGKLYASTWMGRLAVLDFEPDPVVSLLGLPNRPWTLVGCMGQMRNLVESCGEIFMVFSEYMVYTGIIIMFTVCKADLVEEKWVRVQSIGDRAFFLCSGRSVSCSARESGIKGDSIYYVQIGDPKLYRFDMADRSVSMDMPCPNLTKPWNAPHWIFM